MEKLCYICGMRIEKWENDEKWTGHRVHSYCADVLKVKENIERIMSFKEVKRE